MCYAGMKCLYNILFIIQEHLFDGGLLTFYMLLLCMCTCMINNIQNLMPKASYSHSVSVLNKVLCINYMHNIIMVFAV